MEWPRIRNCRTRSSPLRPMVIPRPNINTKSGRVTSTPSPRRSLAVNPRRTHSAAQPRKRSLQRRASKARLVISSAFFLNPKRLRAASHYQRISMKTLPLCICSIALAVAAMGQPAPPPPPPPASAASASVAASVSPAQDLADKIHQRIEKKLKGHHGTVIDGDKDEDVDLGKVRDLGEDIAIPIVAIVFLTIFGAPVMIVAVIMYFGFSRNRMMHRTIRMMAEKGQPIPPALLAPPTPAIRQRSDMRRGVVLCMVGLGLMLFFGAVNEWEGGSWAIGVIPFVIGLGYLLVWKLEGKKDVSPPPPAP